jgi:hypothetical protein
MPLMRYFGFVGSALFLLLFGLAWYLPQPVVEPVRAVTDKPVIRLARSRSYLSEWSSTLVCRRSHLHRLR